jgi:hypothetical protein
MEKQYIKEFYAESLYPIVLSEKEEAAHQEAKHIQEAFEACKLADISFDEKLLQCRALIRRLKTVFVDLRGRTNTDVSDPLHWAIMDYLDTFTDDEGNVKAGYKGR